MATKPKGYRIRFKKRKGGLTYTWVRFYHDIIIARKNAKKVIEREYGDDAKIVSVKRISKLPKGY